MLRISELKMQSFTVGQANTLYVDMVAKATGSPIIVGTVNVYLMAKSGSNAGKWFRGSDNSWQSSESIAGAASHVSDGHWSVSIASEAWTSEINYVLYAKETGDLHIPYTDEVLEIVTPSEVSFEATVTD
jgi:hypothetical protein